MFHIFVVELEKNGGQGGQSAGFEHFLVTLGYSGVELKLLLTVLVIFKS